MMTARFICSDSPSVKDLPMWRRVLRCRQSVVLQCNYIYYMGMMEDK